MHRFRERMRPFLGSRAFNKGALSVMLPVMVQQFVNSMFNMVDNLMVGSLDLQGYAMSAVSVANKPILIFNGILFGLAGAGGLLISQYFGAKDRKSCVGIFWLEITLALLSAAGFFVCLFSFPETLMRLFVTDPHTVELGAQYMRIISFSYFPAAVSGVCIFSLRSIGQNRTSMIMSLCSMAINATFNYLLIFGSLGFPRLGVRGAALATLLARLFELTFYLTLMLRGRLYYTFTPSAGLKLEGTVRRQFRAKAVPLVVNELLYSLGLSMFFWCYARMDETALPALTIAELAYQISAVIFTGNSSAVSVLIGAELGAGRLDLARDHAKKLFSLTIVIGLISAMLCSGLALVLPYCYNLNDSLRTLATRLTLVMALFSPAGFVYAFCFFCLRAGGETRDAALLDGGYLWAVPVPASILIALLLPGKLSIFLTVLILQVLQNGRIFPGLIVLRKGRWLRNLTLEPPA
ncbi:MAG: MATE family efflux transporter [Candidatus Limiplasma sp.]|nr:MATE family efflux transporter [Candidatus Limiplasma sp.]